MTILQGDCREQLARLDADSVDACVTDPPYELGFMGKRWDSTGVAYDPAVWSEVLRVLKPGAFLLAFGGTRTYHRLTCAIEDAGFEIRDSIAAWVYGSGFPKSRSIGKDIDRLLGEPRPRVELRGGIKSGMSDARYSAGGQHSPTAPLGGTVGSAVPVTETAARWEGWGTALKPSWEPIIVARKPLAGTVAANVLTHGVGGLNIDGCRVATDWATDPTRRGWQGGNSQTVGVTGNFGCTGDRVSEPNSQGRWPANTVLAHHPGCGDTCHPDCWVTTLDGQSGTSRSVASERGLRGRHDAGSRETERIKQYSGGVRGHADQGGASRFFSTFRYEAKAPTRERPKVDGVAHPTVKPLALMRWLCRLVTPPGGLILDPFLGSGTTAEAAELEGFRWVGCEQNVDYLPLIQARLDRVADVQLRLPA
jgi:hypothetical protein